MAKDEVKVRQVVDALREELQAVGYTTVEIREEMMTDLRLGGLDLSREMKFLCAAYEPDNEPNFIRGLATISRRYGYDGLGTAREGYHRVMAEF